MANFTQTDPGALTDPSAGQSVIRRMVLGALASQGALPGSTRPEDLVATAAAPRSNPTKRMFSPDEPTTEPGAIDNPSGADVMHQILAATMHPSRGLDTFQRPAVTRGSLATLSTQRPWSETLPGAVARSSDSSSNAPGSSEMADLWGTRSYGGAPRITRPPKLSAGALISPEMFKAPTEHAPTNTRPGEFADSTPLTPAQLRQSGRPAMAQYEQDANAAAPALQQPKQLGKFANTMGTIGEIALDSANLPQAGEIVGEHATNAGVRGWRKPTTSNRSATVTISSRSTLSVPTPRTRRRRRLRLTSPRPSTAIPGRSTRRRARR